MSMAVAISALVSAYTAVRIQLASTRTSVDTHAPLLTDDSAAATCLRSSRVTRRTKTFVSRARMFFLHVAPHVFVELFYFLRSGCPLGKDRSVNIFLGIPASFAHDYRIAFLVPLQDRAGADTEFSSHFRWNRYLTLSGNLRLRYCHTSNYRGNGSPSIKRYAA